MSKSKYDNIFKKFKDIDKGIEDFGKVLGTGGFGEVKEVKYNGKNLAAKLTEKKGGNFYLEKLKGNNIVKIYKILEEKIDKKDYILVIMERAAIKDLKTMINALHDNNFFKLINKPFFELIGNNFVRYFTKQIIKGLELLDRNDLVHFDIKPENILIQSGLKLKITDFSFLMNLQEYKMKSKNIVIPGGTPGYITPEFFKKAEIDEDTAKKQDYFALGATLFLLKIGFQMLEYKKNSDDQLTEDRIIDLLQRDICLIRSYSLFDKEFVDFLCSLIHYVPEERPNFEEIFRNKWLNKHLDDISLLKIQFLDGEEDKFMKELVKSDFYLEKQNEIKKGPEKRSNFIFEE